MRELRSGTTYNTHNTTSLIRTLKYVSDILQTEEALTVEEYKHTHTHAVKGDWQFTTRQLLFDMVNSWNTECSFQELFA